jgi:hypothetical protein
MNGNQVVTMNGNYLQINDDCRYMLAADFENQTFNVAANIQNGKMASIVVSSGTQMIEVLPEGQQVSVCVHQNNNVIARFTFSISPLCNSLN